MAERIKRHLALARFVARVLFVDDVNTALAAYDFASSFALFERFERIGDFHDPCPLNERRKLKSYSRLCQAGIKLA